MNEACTAIKDGIARKLKAARKMIDYDKEVAAGIYIYAVEELGKLELLRTSQKIQGCRRIDYAYGFLAHKVKFLKAVEYLKEHNHP